MGYLELIEDNDIGKPCGCFMAEYSNNKCICYERNIDKSEE